MQPEEKFSKNFFLFELILRSLLYKLSFCNMFHFFVHREEPWHGVFVIKKKSGENFWHISFSYHFPYYVFRIIEICNCFYTNISRKKNWGLIFNHHFANILFLKKIYLFILQGEWLSSFLSYTSTEENKN